ncbi:MAG: hypothetical protein M1820_002190 [Bogoriella megaspora]|nr:MAG: hypothetical protein M1820_002190 [Bogoriella megaspora]
MPSTSTSRRKRPYQPSTCQPTLDTYFSRPSLIPSSSAPEPRDLHPPIPQGFPTQPDAVQSSLLQVGLRVRKSVPEGYKTHKTIGDGIFLNNGKFEDGEALRPTSSAPAELQARPGELVPYCGIHHVGGYGVQQSSSQLSVPSLSSQGSVMTAGTASQPATPGVTAQPRQNARKRQLDFDDELLDGEFGEEGDEGDSEGEDEGRLGLTFRNGMRDERQKMPLRRTQSPFGVGLKGRQSVARKPAGGGTGVMLVDDFTEAEFLVPVERMDVDR